jgi:hypothetical protein
MRGNRKRAVLVFPYRREVNILITVLLLRKKIHEDRAIYVRTQKGTQARGRPDLLMQITNLLHYSPLARSLECPTVPLRLSLRTLA